MKYIRAILIILPFMVACSKTKTNPPPVDTAVVIKPKLLAVLDSMMLYTDNIKDATTYRYSYDKYYRLTAIRATYRTGSAVNDSLRFILNYPGSALIPDSYDYEYNNFTYSVIVNQHHVLFYDNQNRIILDSGTSASASTNIVVALLMNRYTYSNGLILSRYYGYTPGDDPQVNVNTLTVDSFSITDGNLTRESLNYIWQNQVQSGDKNDYSISDYPNPLFDKNLAPSLGARLSHVKLEEGSLLTGDFISPRFMSPWNGPDSTNYTTFEKDALGNLTHIHSDNLFQNTTNGDIYFYYHYRQIN